MVVNLCLPHFQTTAHCNKLCADSYDVSNLLSDDLAARRRGFKLEYFLRPPLHVTLQFCMRVELCRVDVELWPCGMDQGSVSRKLEILTCSDLVSATPNGAQEDCKQFKLVGRCELKEEVLVCFKHRNFKHRIPFLEPPPEPPVQAKQQELWSRGMESLNSVAQLRISIPFGGAGSALGIKSLAVWGVPDRSCPSEELVKFQKAHFDSLNVKTRPSTISRVSHLPSSSAKSPRPNTAPSETLIPEEFLDPLTQELMILPVILPSGMVIDSSTLEEYQKHEATWGRLPNDPFTGVPFTQDSKPLPNPVLKNRIDSLILQTGCTRLGSRNSLLSKPHTSKLIDLSSAERPTSSKDPICTENLQAGPSDPGIQYDQSAHIKSAKKRQNEIYVSKDKNQNQTDSKLKVTKRKCESTLNTNLIPPFSSPLNKISKINASLTPQKEMDSSQASHEQRLSDSLDQALSSALQGLPSYTSQSKLQPETGSGQSRCGSCFCSLTVYSSSSPAYSLPCGHLLCRTCLRNVHPSNSQRLSVTCPTCKASASPSTITRVHH